MIDVEGEYLAFFTSPISRKGRNLAADDRIAISVTERASWVRSALVRGRVVKRVGGDAGASLPMRRGIRESPRSLRIFADTYLRLRRSRTQSA